MAIKYRAAAQSSGDEQVPSEDSDVLPDIPAPGQKSVPAGIVTDTPVYTTKSYNSPSTSSSAVATSSQSSTTATPTQSAAASHNSKGLSHGDIVAIIVPIALLAILIPFLIFFYLNRKYRVAAKKRSSHRSSKEAMLQKQSSIQKPPQPRGPKPARPDRTPRRSVIDPPPPDRRNSLGLFNFELSPPSTPGTGWMTPNPRFSIARALQMRRSQPSIVQSQPRSSRGEFDRSQTRDSEQHQTEANSLDPPPPYVTDTAAPKPSHFAPLEQIGTLQHVDRLYGSNTMAPTLPAIAATNGALNVPQPRYTPRHTPRHTPRASSEILQLPDVYGRAYTRSPSPSLSLHDSSHLSRPFSYTAPERISDVSRISDEPEPWRGMRDSDMSSIISPIDSDESSRIHPHHVL